LKGGSDVGEDWIARRTARRALFVDYDKDIKVTYYNVGIHGVMRFLREEDISSHERFKLLYQDGFPIGTCRHLSRGHILKNWMDVKLNLDALATAWELATGNHTKKYRDGWLNGYLDLLYKIVVGGPEALKSWCEKRRSKLIERSPQALKGAYGGVTDEAIFLASTVGRAFATVASAEEVDQKVGEAAERLTDEKDWVSDETLLNWRRYCSHFGNLNSDYLNKRAGGVLPQAHSTLENSRRDGGQVTFVQKVQVEGLELRPFRVTHLAVGIKLLAKRKALENELAEAVSGLGAPYNSAQWCNDNAGMLMMCQPAIETHRFDPLSSAAWAIRKYRTDLFHWGNAKRRWLAAEPGEPTYDILRPYIERIFWPRRASVSPECWSAKLGLWACQELAERYQNADELPPAKITGFADKTGGVRCATIHSSVEVLAARTIMKYILPILKRHRNSQNMLLGQRIKIIGSKNAQLESTDLSKATDRLGSEVAREGLVTLLRGARAPEPLITAAKVITGAHALTIQKTNGDVVEGGTTTCGAFMGLGPSWVLLALCNNFALWRAKIPLKSAVTNGDDALVLAPLKKLEEYGRHLSSLGLVRNEKKSYRSPRLKKVGEACNGVFCERHARGVLETHKNNRVTRQRIVVRAEDSIRLGEAAGVKSLDGQEGYGCVDHLNDLPRGTHRLVRGLAERSAKRMALAGGGPMSLGGGGGGKVNRNTFMIYALQGAHSPAPRRKTKREREDSQALGRRHNELIQIANDQIDPPQGGTKVSEIMSQEAIVVGQARIMDGDHGGRAKPIRAKEHRRHYRQLTKTVSGMKPLAVLNSDKCAARYTLKARQRASHYVRRKQYRRAIRALANDDPIIAVDAKSTPRRAINDVYSHSTCGVTATM
jgi:hypothetical protein